jgi:hypothetical protein
MAGSSNSFVSSQRWLDERPQRLVICCSDGRYRPHIEDFLNERVAQRPDVIALPGGPAGLDAWSSSFDHARVMEESLELLFSSHDLRELWLVAHEGCSYYKKKHPSLAAAELQARQLADLRRAREQLRERRPAAAVRLVYSRVDQGHVKFDEIDPA